MINNTSPRRREIFAVACAAALTLAGCEAMPVGTMDRARFTADSAQAQYDLHFQPGSPAFAPGEQAQLDAFLRSLALGPTQDVVLTMGRSGSPILDGQRAAALRTALARTRTPARVRLLVPPGFVNSDSRPDTVLVQALRYDRIRVDCPGNVAGPYELTTPMPSIGCSNAINLAVMADEKRDLIEPDRLSPAEGDINTAAVERYRADRVKTITMQSTTGN